MITAELERKAWQEATRLKRQVTTEEINRLDLETLDPSKRVFCIYGQMTGDCYSKRAEYLLDKCALPYEGDLEQWDNNGTRYYWRSWEGFFARLLGKSDQREFSFLEAYIAQPEADNAKLIAFLKDEAD